MCTSFLIKLISVLRLGSPTYFLVAPLAPSRNVNESQSECINVQLTLSYMKTNPWTAKKRGEKVQVM